MYTVSVKSTAVSADSPACLAKFPVENGPGDLPERLSRSNKIYIGRKTTERLKDDRTENGKRGSLRQVSRSLEGREKSAKSLCITERKSIWMEGSLRRV